MTMTIEQGQMSTGRLREADTSLAVLDLAHLRRFTAGNRELEFEVLQMFADQAPLTLRLMQLAHSEKEWRDAAHTLKGSAFAVGANVLARTAAEAELTRGDTALWPHMLLRLDRAVAEVRGEVRRLLATAA